MAPGGYRVSIRGTVQGVGFRPFVYRLAQRYALRGWVANSGSGVEIEVYGEAAALQEFLARLREPPPLAHIAELLISELTGLPSGPSGPPDFQIRPSGASGRDPGPLPADSELCPACLHELFTPADRRYLYPFINCTDCGPRYTLIETIPFDRQATAMRPYPMCPDCAAEYHDPADRRFHCQATCCAACGPHYRLYDGGGALIASAGSDAEAIAAAASMLRQGAIVAIKGLGGIHLAVDATTPVAVELLRQRKRRPAKPLAVMAPDLATVATFAQLSALEHETLLSPAKPIVLLRKNSHYHLAAAVAPQTIFIGVMLPYAPVHYLLFRERTLPVLVMTSGNVAGSPIITANAEALAELSGIADFFLLHDRQILVGTDDSVVRCHEGRGISLLRRSRSYVPQAVELSRDAGKTLAFGGMLKNTFCLTRGKSAFLSHHIGDLDHPETLARLRASITHLRTCLRLEPDLVAHDIHPHYPSTALAKEYAAAQQLPLVAVQHHHAHAVSCLAEHGLAGPAIGVIFDGSGWGSDGTIWGGEILLVELGAFARVGHLTPVAMPGGELAVRQPWRMALAYLHAALGAELNGLELPLLSRYGEQLPLLVQMIERGVNSPRTSSCGRLFDAVAVLLGADFETSFEGQAAAQVEMIAEPREDGYYAEALAAGSELIFATPALMRAVVAELRRGVAGPLIAARFQNTLVQFISRACQRLRRERGLEQVVLSGGVFQNLSFCRSVESDLVRGGLAVYTQHKVPAGDGGLALGQAVAAREMWQRKKSSGAMAKQKGPNARRANPEERGVHKSTPRR